MALQISDAATALKRSTPAGLDAPRAVALEACPAAAIFPTSISAGARLNILWLPGPPSIDLPDSIELVRDQDEQVDTIVLSGANGRLLVSSRASKATAAIVPTIDASGQGIGGADITLPMLTPQTLMLALQSLAPIIERVRSLPKSVFESSDPRLWLLARLATRDGAAEPLRDVSAKSTIRYADEAAVPDLLSCAERLSRSGHLQRHFFDRLNVCPACSSARLLIREECRDCRSTDITEEAIIHHLRCAYQGPERDFREGQELVCPKCRAGLEHFSVDYDKPGTLIVCNACGHTTGEPAIGYLCLDCWSKGDTGLLHTRVVHSYTLAERGRQVVFSNEASASEAASTRTQELRSKIRLFLAEHRALGIPCAVLVVRLDAKAATTAGIGADAISAAADFFDEMLHESFTPDTEILRTGMTFTVLISGDSPAAVKADLAHIRETLEDHLKVDLQPVYEVMSAEDFEPSAQVLPAHA